MSECLIIRTDIISVLHYVSPDPEAIKLFSCSTQLSTKFQGTLYFMGGVLEWSGVKFLSGKSSYGAKFQLLIKTKILTYKEVFFFKSLRCCIYHAIKC